MHMLESAPSASRELSSRQDDKDFSQQAIHTPKSETTRKRHRDDTHRANDCLFVGLLLNVPATWECISGMDLLRPFYVLPP